jgi:hypothetical protein
MIEDVLHRLDKVKKSGKGYQAQCPAHEDKGPSLSLREGEDGRVLLHCFAGCSTGAVVAAMGLTMADLFPASEKPRRPPPAPGVSRRELQAAADFERAVLFIIKCDAKRGRPISQTDMRRGQVARQRINLAGRFA